MTPSATVPGWPLPRDPDGWTADDLDLSVTEDRLVKPAHYARAGIPHYWRFEPEGPLLLTYALRGDVYVEIGRFDDLVEITDPVVLTFRLADLLDRPCPQIRRPAV